MLMAGVLENKILMLFSFRGCNWLESVFPFQKCKEKRNQQSGTVQKNGDWCIEGNLLFLLHLVHIIF